MPSHFALGELYFTGPVALESVPDDPGVYVVLAVDQPECKVIEVGDSANLHEHLEDRQKADRWRRHKAFGVILFGYYVPDGLELHEREELSRMVRRDLSPAGAIGAPVITLAGSHYWNLDERARTAPRKK